MKKKLQLLILLIALSLVRLNAQQVSVTSSTGTPSANYTTLGAVCTAIAAGTHTGVIVVKFNASTTETGTCTFVASGTGSASYTSIEIRPADTALAVKTISTAASGVPLIVYDGADNITIDGRPVGSLSNNKLLSFSHTVNAASSHTFRLANNATFNSFRYIEVLNATTGTTLSTTILFSTPTSAPSNSNNTIEFCNITGGNIGIDFNGSNTFPASNNIIRANNISNQTATAVKLTVGVGTLLIDSNNVFHTVATTTGGYQFLNIALIDPSATVTVTKNRVFNLNTAAGNFLQGIIFSPTVACGTLIVRNNSIAIGSTTFPNTLSQIIRCLLFSGTGQATVVAEHNTFRIGGTHVTANGNPTTVGVLKSNSNALSSFTYRNNLVINSRTGSANQHVGSFVSTPTTGTNVIDYNTYMGGGTFINAWIGTFHAAIGTYKAAAFPLEQNSTFGLVDFNNVTEPSVNLAGPNTSGAKLLGTPIAAVTTDYYGNVRSATRPYKGAFESSTPIDTFDLQTIIQYTYGKIPLGTDDTVRAVIRNNGALAVTGVPIHLRSSAAGYIGSVNLTLPSGSDTILSLVPYSPFVLGNDTLTVNGAPDQKTSNDTAIWIRQNTLNALSYTNTTLAQSGNVGTNPEGEIVAKFYTPVSNFLNQVNVNFTNTVFNGPFPFQIVLYEDSGANLGPKLNPVWVSTTQNTINGVFNLSIPSISVLGNFYIGVRQTTSNNIGFAFQTENPIRNKTFYFRQGTGYITSAWNDFAVNPANQFRFMIEPRLSINDDLGVTDLAAPGTGCVNLGSQPVQFQVQNLGLLNQNFAVDVLRLYGTITKPSGNIISFGPILVNTGTLSSGATTNITAFSSFNFDSVGSYVFKAWTVFTPDGNKVNDTLPALTRVITAINNIPLVENFNAVTFPASWTTNRFFLSTTTGYNGTNNARVNLNNGSTFAANASITGPRIAGINARSVLRFDYKVINNLGGTATTLLNLDSIKLLISTDCGNTYTMVNLINGVNHIPSTSFTTFSIPLSAYVGSNVTFKIVCDWFGTTNDALLDIDNIRFINDSNDVTLSAVNNPCKSLILNSSSFAPQLQVTNAGLNAQSSIPVTLQITGPVNYTGAGTITSVASSASAVANLSTNFNPNTAGTYTAKAWVSLANDADRLNDTLQFTFTVVNTNRGDSAVNAISLGGAGNLFASHSGSLNINGNQLSIEAWLRSAAFTSAKQTIVHKNNGSTVKYALSLDSLTNKVLFEINTANGLVSALSNVAISLGTWVHVAATYNGSLMTIYINGHEVGWATQTGNIVSNTANLLVGKGLTSTNFYQGQIDELKIWNTSRTAAQVRAGMHTRNANASSVNLVAYYRFDEGGTSTTVVDASGNCNALTFTGTTLPTFAASRLALGSPVVDAQVFFSSAPTVFTGTGLTLTLNGFSGQDTISVHRFNGLPRDSVPTGIATVYAKYWIVYKYGNNTYANVDASFNLGSGSLLSSVAASDLSLFNRANTSNVSWSLLSNPASFADFSTQSVTFNTTSSTIFDKQWSIGGNNNPLPVKLMSFVGNKLDNTALLNWVTASELNNDYFIVLQSTDGLNYKTVGKLKGAGNSNIKQSYNFQHNITDIIQAGNKVVYYKLIQVDFDGKRNELPIVSIALDNNQTDLEVMPNPFSNEIQVLTISGKEEMALITIVDVNGKEVMKYNVKNDIGANRHVLTTDALATGLYFVKVKTGDNVTVKKVVKN